MKKYGSYILIKDNGMVGIGLSRTPDDLQPYVVWDLRNGNVWNAVFFSTFEEAERNYVERSKYKRIEKGEI